MEMVITKSATNLMKSNALNIRGESDGSFRAIFLPRGWKNVTVEEDGFVTVVDARGQVHGFKAAQARLVNAPEERS